MEKKDSYQFRYGVSREKGLFYVELQDRTQLVFSDGKDIEEGVTLRLEREKFLPIIQQQVDENPDSEYIQMTFSPTEVEALKEAVKQIRGKYEDDC